MLIYAARKIYAMSINCDYAQSELRRHVMDGERWQKRAKEAGLSQVMLARLLGRPVNTISRQIRGQHGAVPKHLSTFIVAWELMTPEQREAWLAMSVDEP